MATVLDWAGRSLRMLGVLAAGQVPSGQMAADALEAAIGPNNRGKGKPNAKNAATPTPATAMVRARRPHISLIGNHHLRQKRRPLRAMHIAIFAAALHDGTWKREFHNKQIRNIKPFHQLRRLMIKPGNGSSLQRAAHMCKPRCIATKHINRHPERPCVFGPHLDHMVLHLSHFAPHPQPV